MAKKTKEQKELEELMKGANRPKINGITLLFTLMILSVVTLFLVAAIKALIIYIF